MTPEERAWAEASIASRSREAKRARMRAEVQRVLACRDRLYPENDAALTRELQIPRSTVVATRLVLKQSMRLGRERDATLADELGVSRTHVSLVREALNIAARNEDIEDTFSLQKGRVVARQELLGTRPDPAIAEELYVPTLMVAEIRRSLGIHHFVPSRDTSGRDRVMAHHDRLGRVPDHVLASDIGVSTTLVWQTRTGLNIPSFAEEAAGHKAERKDDERLKVLMEDLAARRREREAAAAEALRRKVEEKRMARDARSRAARNRWHRAKKYHNSSVTTEDLDTVEVWSGDLQWPEEELLDWEPDMAWELGLKVCTMWRVLGRVMSADSLGAYRLCEEAVLFDRKPKTDR